MTRTQLLRIAAGSAVLGSALLLAGCGGPTATPAPDGTTTPAAVGATTGYGSTEYPDHGWLVTAKTSFLEASNRICSFETRLLAAEGDSFGTQGDGGETDDWTPAQTQVLDPNNIGFDVSSGEWQAQRYTGSAGTGDIWIAGGEFQYEVGADGYITEGSGTGTTVLDTAGGDRIESDETVTFTVDEIPDPPWCEAVWEMNND